MDRPHPLAGPPRHGRVVVRVGEPLAPDAPDLPLAEFLTARWGLHTARLRRTCYLRNRRSWPDAACP